MKYIHQSGHTKEKADHIANILNNAYTENTDVRAIVMTDEEAKAAMKEDNDASYFVVLEDGCVVFIEVTPEMQKEIDSTYDGDIDDYFASVICDEYNISINNCEWSITSEACVTCYGRPIQITA